MRCVWRDEGLWRGVDLRLDIGSQGWSNLTVGPHLAPFPLADGTPVSLRVLLDRGPSPRSPLLSTAPRHPAHNTSSPHTSPPLHPAHSLSPPRTQPLQPAHSPCRPAPPGSIHYHLITPRQPPCNPSRSSSPEVAPSSRTASTPAPARRRCALPTGEVMPCGSTDLRDTTSSGTLPPLPSPFHALATPLPPLHHPLPWMCLPRFAIPG